MNILLNFAEDFKMHAEGVGSDLAQKIESAWHRAELTLLNAEGEVERVFSFGKDGSLEVKDKPDAAPSPQAAPDAHLGAETDAPASEQPGPVEAGSEPSASPVAASGAEPDAGEPAAPVPESGFAAMSQHADAMADEGHETGESK